jgi:hypothetical protein
LIAIAAIRLQLFDKFAVAAASKRRLNDLVPAIVVHLGTNVMRQEPSSAQHFNCVVHFLSAHLVCCCARKPQLIPDLLDNLELAFKIEWAAWMKWRTVSLLRESLTLLAAWI